MHTILIVEEGPINRHFEATLLRDHGHRVFEAANSGDALKVVRAEAPDLMLIDMLMSTMDAVPFVLGLRSEPELVQPRVMLRAAVHVEGEARALASALRIALLPRPANPTALLAAVEVILADPRPTLSGPQGEAPAADALLRPVVRKLCRYTANLERLNVQLDRHLVESSLQLESTRYAMDQEIKKRLWAEHALDQANHSLRHEPMRDALTGLHNRRYLEESLAREESRARRRGEMLGILLIDVDGVKACNDTLGHAAGDAVLRAMAQYLVSVARSEDLVSRYGGDEFVLVMGLAPPHTVSERAEELRRGAPTREIEFEGRRIGPVTLSIGVAIFPVHGESGQAVLRAAEMALHGAKRAGGNRIGAAARPALVHGMPLARSGANGGAGTPPLAVRRAR